MVPEVSKVFIINNELICDLMKALIGTTFMLSSFMRSFALFFTEKDAKSLVKDK